jgi:hypothetical protein
MLTVQAFSTMVLGVASLALCGCNVSTLPSRPDQPDARPAHAERSSRGARTSATRDDAPEISRSRGREGGAIVLYPRVIPRGDDPELARLAELVQRRLGSIAASVHGDAVERRPAPERVCPREGCMARSLGAVVARNAGGCTVVAVVGEPGPEPLRLVPWAGTVRLSAERVPFREPPESAITVTEHAKCTELIEALEANAPIGEEQKLKELLAAPTARP